MPVTGPQQNGLFLPNFCQVRTVLAVVLICELLAMVLTLAPLAPRQSRWDNLALISLFVQWLGLSSTALLCVGRRWLGRLAAVPAALVSYALLLLNTAFFGELAYQTHVGFGLGLPAPVDHSGFMLRLLAISAIINAVVLRYFYVQHQWKQQIRAESRARLEALQARIRPHFLFNTLNTIASLTRSRPAEAEEAIEDLSDLLRINLSAGQEMTLLEDELTLCRRYLHIEGLRLGQRLQVDWALDGVPLDARVPPLIIQPLLENAIYHGVEGLVAGGTIQITGHSQGGLIALRIENPLPDPTGDTHTGHRLALDNIRQRLAAAYGEAGTLTTDATPGTYTVEIRFPVQAGGRA